MNGLTEAKEALEELRRFIGKSQLASLRELFRGEERHSLCQNLCQKVTYCANLS